MFFDIGIHGVAEAQKREEVEEKALVQKWTDYRFYIPVGRLELREEVSQESPETNDKWAVCQVFFFYSYKINFFYFYESSYESITYLVTHISIALEKEIQMSY